MTPPPSTLRSTLIVSVTRTIGMLLVLALGMLSATYFGTSPDKDSYLIAQTLPNIVTAFVLGGIWSTLLVTLAEVGQREGVQGQIDFAKRTLRRLAIFLGPCVLVGLLFPEPIVRAFAPGFDPIRVALSANLLRLSAVLMLGSVSFVVLRCLFEVRSNFVVPCWVNLLNPLISLVTLVLLVKRIGIYALALGPLAGAAAAVTVLAFLALHILKDSDAFTPHPDAGALRPEAHRRFWIAFLPMSIGANCGQINLMVDNAFASYLPSGSITTLGFAFVIISNAELLSTLSLAEVAFPRLNSAALLGSGALGETLRSSVRYMILLTVPLAAGTLTFGTPLTRLLFERGVFGPEATAATASLLRCYGPGIVFTGYALLFSRTLIARKRFAWVAWVALVSIGANCLLDFFLLRAIGLNGIALATTLVSLLQALALAALARREVDGLRAPGETRYVVKVCAGAALMAALLTAYSRLFEHYVDTAAQIPRLVEVGIGLSLAAACYIFCLHLLRVEEARGILRELLRAVRSQAQAES